MPVPLRRPDHVYRLGPLELEIWRISSNSRIRYAYRMYDLEWSELPVFEWDDFKMPEWATIQETALDILYYLTLREWDVEGWFFKDYTPEQFRWRDARAEKLQQEVLAEARRTAAAPVRSRLIMGAKKRRDTPKDWSPRKGEKTEVFRNLGDEKPLDYGGFLVLRMTSPDEVEASYEAEFWPEPEGGKYTVYRVGLDRLKKAGDHLVPFEYGADWPHPVERYDEWFHQGLDDVASFVGSTRAELEADFSSADPVKRAWAYRAVADYHGWDNFDSYPLELTREEMEKRWPEFA